MVRDPRIGSRVGSYVIEAIVGRGGMGVVYLGTHEHLHRKAAVKVLAPELAGDLSFRERFVRESRLSAGLRHPNVIPVYDAGEWEDSLYIAMLFVEGTDLRTVVLRDGALDVGRATVLLGQVASALDAAHAQGLVHRDVKPANVLVEPGPPEHVYLSDFGLTRHIAQATALTRTGQFVGSLGYVAPEQIQGTAIDARTDVYALGCVAYECLVGEAPWADRSEVAAIYAHLSEPPPQASVRRSDLPQAVDAVLARAMAKSAEARYASCGAFVEDLRRALAPEPTTAVRPAGEPAAPREPPPQPRGAQTAAATTRVRPEPWAPPPAGSMRSGGLTIAAGLACVGGLVLTVIGSRGTALLGDVFGVYPHVVLIAVLTAASVSMLTGRLRALGAASCVGGVLAEIPDHIFVLRFRRALSGLGLLPSSDPVLLAQESSSPGDGSALIAGLALLVVALVCAGMYLLGSGVRFARPRGSPAVLAPVAGVVTAVAAVVAFLVELGGSYTTFPGYALWAATALTLPIVAVSLRPASVAASLWAGWIVPAVAIESSTFLDLIGRDGAGGTPFYFVYLAALAFNLFVLVSFSRAARGADAGVAGIV